MSNTNILIYALANAMNIPTFSTPSSTPTHFPTSFGVFAGVSRSKAFQLKEWPHDVHGSNGYWNNNYKALSNNDLWRHILSVSKTAVNEGGYDRAKMFPDLSWDFEAEFSIKFMLKNKHSPTPISENGTYINKHNDEVIFNNKNVGIIVINTESGDRATYLTGVYENMSFEDITDHLHEKSQSQSSKQLNRYYAYELQTISIMVGKLLSISYLTGFFSGYIDTINNYINNSNDVSIPYEINTSTSKAIYNGNDGVRNVATIRSILQSSYIIESPLNPKLKKQLNKDFDYYVKNYNNDVHVVSQILMLMSIVKNKTYHKVFDTMCTTLINKTKNNDLEEQFEKPQVYIAISSYCKTNLDLSNFRVPVTIFELNWQAQLAAEYNNVPFGKKLYSIFIKKFANTYKNTQMPPNHVFVCFECVCAFHKLLRKAKNWILYLLVYILRNHFSIQYNIVYHDVPNARLDFTGHIINGLSLILPNT